MRKVLIFALLAVFAAQAMGDDQVGLPGTFKPPLFSSNFLAGEQAFTEFKSLVNSGFLKLSEERGRLLQESLQGLEEKIKAKRDAYARVKEALEGKEVEGLDLDRAEQLDVQALVDSAALEFREFFASDSEWEDGRAAYLRMVLVLGSDGFDLNGVLRKDWVRMRAGISEGQVFALRAVMRADELRKARFELINTNPAKNRGQVHYKHMDGYPEYLKKLIRLQLSVLSEEEAANLDEILQLDDDHELSLRKNWRILIKRKGKRVGTGSVHWGNTVACRGRETLKCTCPQLDPLFFCSLLLPTCAESLSEL